MKISVGRQHSASSETYWLKFACWVGLSPETGLSTTALVIVFAIICSGSSLAKDIGSTKRQKTEIPFELCNGNLIIVKATVGFFKNVNVILDTGTSPTAINQVMADRLNLQGKSALLQTLTGTIQVQTVTLPLVQIGPLHADSIRGVVQDLTLLERSLGISLGGIAGLDILRSSSFVIDYRRRKIIFGSIAGDGSHAPAKLLTLRGKEGTAESFGRLHGNATHESSRNTTDRRVTRTLHGSRIVPASRR